MKYPTSRAEFLSLTCVSGDFWSVFLFVVRKVRAKAVRKINRGLTRQRWEGERGETEKRSEFFPWLLSMAPPRSFFSSTLGKVLRVLRAGDDRMDQTVQKLAPKKSDIEFPSLDKFGCTFLGRTTRPRYTGTNTNLHIVLNTLPHPLQKTCTWIKPPKNILAKFFYPQKIPEAKISNPKESFDHSRHLKFKVLLLQCSTSSFTKLRTTNEKHTRTSRKTLHESVEIFFKHTSATRC